MTAAPLVTRSESARDRRRAAAALAAAPALGVGAEPARLLTGTAEARLADAPLARPMHHTSGTTGRCKGVWSGVPDEDRGQRVAAAYVGAAAPADLAVWALERLAAAKRPRALHPLGELPRTATGKVRRLDSPEVLGLPGA